MSLLDGLDPSFRPRVEAFLRLAKARGHEVILTEGHRSTERQAALYAKGRAEPGPRVTNAPPGSSWHEFRLAVDFVPLKDGKPWWAAPLGIWEELGELLEKAGCEWGGRFKTILDMPHGQYRGGLTLTDVRTGIRPEPLTGEELDALEALT